MADQQRSRLPVIIGVVAVVLIAAVGGFFYFTRDTSDAKLTLTEDTAGSGDAVEVATLDGPWTVAAGSGDSETVAGYRVEEEFAAGARRATANGRTNDITGSLTVADGTVTEGEFTVDLTTLTSDESRRDSSIRTRGLETTEFPDGTFTLTEPIELPSEFTDGETFDVTGVGELTLHGVTQPVTVDLTARAVGDTFTVQGAAPVAMADYDIEPPSVGGFVTVSDTGSFEFIVNFEPAS